MGNVYENFVGVSMQLTQNLSQMIKLLSIVSCKFI